MIDEADAPCFDILVGTILLVSEILPPEDLELPILLDEGDDRE